MVMLNVAISLEYNDFIFITLFREGMYTIWNTASICSNTRLCN